MTSLPCRDRGGNAKKASSVSNVTCSRCGLVQTANSFKRHFPQCTGPRIQASVLQEDNLLYSDEGHDPICFTNMDNETDLEDESRYCSRLSSSDFNDNLSNHDYDDEDSCQAFEDMLTAAENSSSPTPDPCLIPATVRPSPFSPSSSTNSLSSDDSYPDEEDPNHQQPFGSTEVSVELEVAQNYSHKDFSRQEQSMAALLAMFTSTGCRLSLFDDVFSRVKRDVKLGHLDLNKVATRKTFLSRLRLKFPDIDIRSTDVPFPNKAGHPPRKFTVFVFDLLAQLQDMLDDFTVYGDVNKLNVNSDPRYWFHPKETDSPSQQYTEIMNSPWYQRTVLKMNLNPDTDLLIPCALYHNFTGVDVYQKHSLGPWMISLLLPKTDVREKSSSWRHMFMIPDVGKAGKGLSSEEKNRSFHEGLRIGLLQLVQLQKNPPLMDVRIGGYKKKMRVHFVISLILGDQESSDKICARMPSHKNAVRLHRACMTSALHSSDASHSCIWVDPNNIKRLVKLIIVGEDIINGKEHSQSPVRDRNDSWEHFRDHCLDLGYNTTKLTSALSFLKRKVKIARALLYKMYATYPVTNAFWDVDFGDNAFGVYRATVDDAMHFDELGKITYIAESFLQPFSDSDSSQLDSLVEKLLSKSTLRSSARYHQPRLNYHRGFSRLSLLTASEHVGVLFACYIILHTSEGEALAAVVLRKQQDRYKQACVNTDSCSTVNRYTDGAEQTHEKEDNVDDNEGDNSEDEDNDSVTSHPDLSSHTPTPSNQRQKKPDEFPNTKEAFKFVIDVLKRYQLHFVLDVSLDPLQLGSVMRSLWPSIGHQLWKQRDDEVRLSTYFPQDYLLSPLLEHDLYNPSYHGQIMASTFALEEEQVWLDFMDYKKGDYPKQNQVTQGFVFIPKHGIVPKVSAAEAKLLSTGKSRKVVGKSGKTAAILCDEVKDFKMFLEVCLGWHAFCHYSYLLEPAQRQNMRVLDVATRRMIEMFDQFVYRGHTTNDSRTCKCHSHLHATHTYQEYGDPRQYNAGKGERGLKDWAKFPAKTAQKRDEETFLKQTTSRIQDAMLLDRSNRVLGYLFKDTVGSAHVEQCVGAEHMGPYRLRYTHPRWIYTLSDGVCLHLNRARDKFRGDRVVDPYLLKWLKKDMNMIDGDVLEIFTEICKDNFEESLRAHPHYTRGGEPWYDWAMIEWYNSESSIPQNVPGKLLLFYRIEGSTQVWALVHCCGYETFTEGMFETSAIISRHELCFQPSSAHRSVATLERITINSISHGVVGIEEMKSPGGKLNSIRTDCITKHKVMVIADRKNAWASQFMDWGEQIYEDANYNHLRNAFINPDDNLQCTEEDASLFLLESESSGSNMQIDDYLNSVEERISDTEMEFLGDSTLS